MSMITRCPACKTTFRVVPDQLRISEGWVRCGQCQEIFDANAALVDAVAPSLQEVVAPTPTQQGSATFETDNAEEWPDQSEAMLQELSERELPDLSLNFGAGDHGAELPLKPESIESVAPTPDASPEISGGPAELTAQMPHEVLAQAAREDASFMRKMPEKATGKSRIFNILLGLSALFLSGALLAQFAVHERDRIAAMFPQAKPALVWICGQLNCVVSNLRQIESVVIDSTSLNKVRGDAYRLSLAMRNTSPLEIATPSLELTLTDSQDRPVMRRVLLAAEFSGASTLGAVTEWSGAVTVAVRGNGADRFSGYKVLAFYP